MFSTLGLFRTVACPDGSDCARQFCLFGHKDSEIKPLPRLRLLQPPKPALVPSKRSVSPDQPELDNNEQQSSKEPPQKARKVNAKSTPLQSTSLPLIKDTPATSKIPVPTRQSMLFNLFKQFVELYSELSVRHPNLAREHAISQEEEIYGQSTQYSYRSAVISAIANLKKRPKPKNMSHLSVGTTSQVAKREADRDTIRNLIISRDMLTPLLLSEKQMSEHGYCLEVPLGEGGNVPNAEGSEAMCDRCNRIFRVKADPNAIDCTYHWGKTYSIKVPGEKEKKKVLSCCSQDKDSQGCTQGPHVFYEKEYGALHSRFPFSKFPDKEGGIDVVALDCEMIYTTAGMRLAHVSVVDGSGNTVLDEPVRLEEGVKVIDYNTRFSGVTTLASAKLKLCSVQEVLSSSINSSTIIIGHALENDLKALRIIHSKCVDTAALFPHPGGLPYRRSLKELSRQRLGLLIQEGGGVTGHSSLEDAKATLDLVRSYILDRRKKDMERLAH